MPFVIDDAALAAAGTAVETSVETAAETTVTSAETSTEVVASENANILNNEVARNVFTESNIKSEDGLPENISPDIFVDKLPTDTNISDIKIQNADIFVDNLQTSSNQCEIESSETNTKDLKNCPIDGNNGHWDGERGNSVWRPDADYVPQKNNPDGKTWGEIMEEYGVDGIPFEDGEPDFSQISKGEVTLDAQESDRGLVFNEADAKLAEQKGCTPEEVRQWRKENGYTWHEKQDGLTVQKVPSIIHGNVSHLGGHSVTINSLK